MRVPYVLANGAGNLPDATKWMGDYDWLTSLLLGSFISNGGLETWTLATSFTNPANGASIADNWTWRKSGSSGATADVSREATNIDSGTYSGKINITVAGSADSVVAFDQAVPDHTRFKGETMVFGAKVKLSTGTKARLKINDGVTSPTYSEYHTGGGAFEHLQVSQVISTSLTGITLSLEVVSDFTGAIYFDSAYLYAIPSQMAAAAKAFLVYSDLLTATFPRTGGTIQGNVGINGDLDMNGNDVREVASLNDTFLSGFRNRIINGDMRIDQRKAGASKTINNTTGSYTLDRWFAVGESADGVFTVQRSTSTPPTGFTHFARVTATTADASIGASQQYSFMQIIEGSVVRDLLWGSSSAKTITISFWVRSSLTGAFSGSLRNSGAARSYPFSYTINAANTWEQKTVTIAGDTSGTWLTTEGIGIYLNFDLGSGTSKRGTAGSWSANNYVGVTSAVSLIGTLNATLDITGVQLEVGAQASSFEYRSDGMEVFLCHRYFQKSYAVETAVETNTTTNAQYVNGSQTNTTTVVAWFNFFRPMRAAPTVALYKTTGTPSEWFWTATGGGGDSGRATSVANTTTYGAEITQTVALEYRGYGHWTAEAEL